MGNTHLSCASGEKGTKAQQKEEQYTKAPVDKPTNGEVTTKQNGTEEVHTHTEEAKDGDGELVVETVERIDTAEIKSQGWFVKHLGLLKISFNQGKNYI